MIISVFGRAENIVGKEKNAGYQHFLFFPTMFRKGFFSQMRQKVSLCGNGLKDNAGKGEMLMTTDFLLMPECFYPFSFAIQKKF